MGSDGTAGEDGGVLRFHGPDFKIRVLGFEHFPDAGEGAAGADTAAVAVDRPGHLGHDLQSGMLFMGQGVVRILKLLRNEDLRILCLHFHGAVQAFLHALADVPGIMDEFHFSAVVADELPALLADGVRHNDDGAVSLDGADQRQADALVAAGRLHDDAVRGKQAFLFRLLNHVQRGAGFDGTADIERFHFDQDFRAVLFRHPVQPNHGRIAHRFKDCIINHNRYTSGNYPIACRVNYTEEGYCIQEGGRIYFVSGTRPWYTL